jgi:hypothetical protein
MIKKKKSTYIGFGKGGKAIVESKDGVPEEEFGGSIKKSKHPGAVILRLRAQEDQLQDFLNVAKIGDIKEVEIAESEDIFNDQIGIEPIVEGLGKGGIIGPQARLTKRRRERGGGGEDQNIRQTNGNQRPTEAVLGIATGSGWRI